MLPDDLDCNATDWLLNCYNGTLDLRTGVLTPHNRSLLITKLAPVAYDPAAECPRWLSFVQRIMDGNDRLITFLQRAIGYSLTGSTRAQVFFVPYGSTGKNGKSTLIECLEGMLGDYAVHARPETFMVKRFGNSVPNDIARLRGARLVGTVETEEGQALAESLIKQITGGDRMTARFMRSEEFTFKPKLKLWLATNHKPKIKGTDDAIWSRPKLIPFTVHIPHAECDGELGEKLRAEWPGILAWAVRGCLDWQREGLTDPDEVRGATATYRNDMDVLRNFLDERCVEKADAWTATKHLFDEYERWCAESNEYTLSKRQFNERVRERGFKDERRTGNVPMWRGLGFRAEFSDDCANPCSTHIAPDAMAKAQARELPKCLTLPDSGVSPRGDEASNSYPKVGNESNFGNAADSGERLPAAVAEKEL